MSKNGTTTWTIAMTASAGQRPRSAPHAPRRIAIGTSTSAPRAMRAKTMKIGAMPSSSATLMNRYDAPHSAARSPMSSHDRRVIGLRVVAKNARVQRASLQVSFATRRTKRAVRGRIGGRCAVSGKRSTPSSSVILKWKICAGGGLG